MKITKAQLTAQCEAQDACIRALCAQLQNSRAHSAELAEALACSEAQLSQFRSNSREVATRAALLAKLRELTQQGVPCRMQGDFITHRATGALLAQVRQ